MAIKSLVTGGCGFVGWNLVDALVARGDEVTVVDLQDAAHRPDVRYIKASITDLDAMRDAATALEGTICQRVFASQPEGDQDLRTVDSVSIETGRLLTFTVVGRSFMRHAIRGMVGTLMEVGYGRLSTADVEAMAAARPGHAPMVKAPAHGLCLVKVDY